MLFKIRTEEEKRFSLALTASQAPEHVLKGSIQQPGTGTGVFKVSVQQKGTTILVCLSVLCVSLRSGIQGRGMGGKDARCHILLMSWLPLQLPKDFGYGFWSWQRSVSASCPPSVSHYKPPWFFVLHGSGSGCFVKLHVDVQGSPWSAHPGAIHAGHAESPASCSQTFPFISVWAFQLQFSAMLFRVHKNVLKPDKGSYCGESKLLSEVN